MKAVIKKISAVLAAPPEPFIETGNSRAARAAGARRGVKARGSYEAQMSRVKELYRELAG
jgi:hypothetical protein